MVVGRVVIPKLNRDGFLISDGLMSLPDLFFEFFPELGFFFPELGNIILQLLIFTTSGSIR